MSNVVKPRHFVPTKLNDFTLHENAKLLNTLHVTLQVCGVPCGGQGQVLQQRLAGPVYPGAEDV